MTTDEYYEGYKVHINNGGYKETTTHINCEKVRTLVHINEGCKKYELDKLPEGMSIHHLDMNKLNNDWSNLMLISFEDHSALHDFLKKHPSFIGMSEEQTKELIEFIRENHDIKTGDEHTDAEIELSRLKSKQERLLKDVNATNEEREQVEKDIRAIRDKLIEIRKEKSLSRLPKPKTREELIEKLEEFRHMENLAKYYGVSSSAIRKWCKNWNIDYHQYGSITYGKKITKLCPVCGKEFTTTDKENKIYCSADCARTKGTYFLDMDEIYKMHYDRGMSYREIARIYGVQHQAIIRELNRYIKKNNIDVD